MSVREWTYGLIFLGMATSWVYGNDVAWTGEETPPRGRSWAAPATSVVSVVNEQPHSGTHCLRVGFKGDGFRQVGWNWFGWYPEDARTHAASTSTLVFWLRASSSEGDLRIGLADNHKGQSSLLELKASGFAQGLPTTWQRVRIPLSKFGATIDPTRLWELRLATEGKRELTLWVDDIAFEPAVRDPSAKIKVRIQADRPSHTISPFIYGASWVTAEKAEQLGITTVRWGGNRSSRYNWKTQSDNAGADWFFLNGTAGSWSDFVTQNHRRGITSYVTIPLLPWVSKGSKGQAFSVLKYGAQEKVEPYNRDFGNGVRADGRLITGNNPADTSVRSSSEFQAEGIRQLPAAPPDKPRIYGLDNEMMLWHATHRDVHPQPASYDEALNLGREFARAIKHADPSGLVAGPCTWGWTDLSFSAADQGTDQYASHADRKAHGDVPFLDWYLTAMRKESEAFGRRLLDLVDVHCYPQGEGVYGSEGDSPALRALRLRSTRGLWDPSYQDESWIHQPVKLIPRIRAIIQSSYPGTQLCLGEYSWGGDKDPSGAIAQVEVLGILARERVEYAYFWSGLEGVQRFAFLLFRNPDGKHQGFGERYLTSRSEDPNTVEAFAARRNDGALTVILINKDLDQTQSVELDFGVEAKNPATLFRLPNPTGPIQRENLSPQQAGLVQLPPLSAAMLVIP